MIPPETLQALIAKWRNALKDYRSKPVDSTNDSQRYGAAVARMKCADELEAALAAPAVAPQTVDLTAYHSGAELCEVCQRAIQSGVWCCDGCLDRLQSAALSAPGREALTAELSKLDPSCSAPGGEALRCSELYANHNRCVRPAGHTEWHLTSTGFDWHVKAADRSPDGR